MFPGNRKKDQLLFLLKYSCTSLALPLYLHPDTNITGHREKSPDPRTAEDNAPSQLSR